MNNSAQGSITIKRLRTGDSLYITLELNGKPLHQAVDPTGGAVSPDWNNEDNQPIITPKVTSARGNSVSLGFFEWKYNGAILRFTGKEAGGWTLDSTGTFKINDATGALRIVKNLASKTNIANDILTFSCIATVAGSEYNLSKSIDVTIQNAGASSYVGTLVTSTGQLSSAQPTASMTTTLSLGLNPITEYTVKWYKDNELMSDKSGKTITINRADVDGVQIFIAEFYVTGTDQPVARAGVSVMDVDDEYLVSLDITSTNKEVDKGKPVTVKAKVVKMKANSETVVLPSEGTVWRMAVIEKKTWQEIKTSATDTIEVTTDETDRDGKESDVEVLAEVTWVSNI